MIEHEGIIEKIEGETICVRILQKSACSDCHAKSYCSASDTSVKKIEVNDKTGKFRVNDTVIIEGRTTMGYKAIIFAYILPLIVMIFGIVLGNQLWGLTDIQSAFLAIASLIPYYLIIYIYRKQFATQFTFSIKELCISNS